MTLMSAGACGAFVHGLEDEFMGECGAELQHWPGLSDQTWERDCSRTSLIWPSVVRLL